MLEMLSPCGFLFIPVHSLTRSCKRSSAHKPGLRARPGEIKTIKKNVASTFKSLIIYVGKAQILWFENLLGKRPPAAKMSPSPCSGMVGLSNSYHLSSFRRLQGSPEAWYITSAPGLSTRVKADITNQLIISFVSQMLPEFLFPACTAT